MSLVEGFSKNIKQQNKIIKKNTIVHINYLNNFLNKHPEMQTVEPGTKPIKFNPVDPSLNLTPWIVNYLPTRTYIY